MASEPPTKLRVRGSKSWTDCVQSASQWNGLLAYHRETRLPAHLKPANRQGQLAKRYGSMVFGVPHAPTWGEGLGTRMPLRKLFPEEEHALYGAVLEDALPADAFDGYKGRDESEAEDEKDDDAVSEVASEPAVSEDWSEEESDGGKVGQLHSSQSIQESDGEYKAPPWLRPPGKRGRPPKIKPDHVHEQPPKGEQEARATIFSSQLALNALDKATTKDPKAPFFRGLVFRILEQSEVGLPDLPLLIRANGGIMEDGATKPNVALYGGRRDNESFKDARARSIPIVSNLFVLDCIAVHHRLPLTRYVVNAKPLDGLHVVLIGEQFSRPAAELNTWVIKHGGRVASFFHSRFNITHVVASAGLKFNSLRSLRNAREMGVPIVSEEWLVQCVIKGMRIDEENFMLTKATYKLVKDRRN